MWLVTLFSSLDSSAAKAIDYEKLINALVALAGALTAWIGVLTVKIRRTRNGRSRLNDRVLHECTETNRQIIDRLARLERAVDKLIKEGKR